MVDVSDKLQQIMKLINADEYFTINRPRQYGKTTTLSLLRKKLIEDFLVLSLSFERLGGESFSDAKTFIHTLYLNIRDDLEFQDEIDLLKVLDEMEDIDSFDNLSRFLTKFVKASSKEVILMIDEVDKASNSFILMDFLGVLRSKYLGKIEGRDETFKSVILAGVHDIKNLKYKQSNERAKYNSPWNIAVDFKVNMDFTSEEIETMLVDYCSERQIIFDMPAIANRIHYFTNGYPFLVSYLCKIIDEDIEGADKWVVGNVDEAVKLMLTRQTTNFDSLIANIENHKDLYNLVWSVLVDGKQIEYNLHTPAMRKGILYGVITNDDGWVRIHNRIYSLIIHSYLVGVLKTEESTDVLQFYPSIQFIKADGSLNMELILEKYMEAMKKLHDDKQDAFIEKNAKLLFSLFIKPIVNGKGFIYYEPVISDRRRLDIAITYNQFQYVVELKIWHGEQYFQTAQEQLYDYLVKEDLDIGYLVVHNFNKNKEFKTERLDYLDKKFFVVYV